MAQQKFVVKISKEYGPIEREAISERIIDQIIKRSKSGIGVDEDGKEYKFKGYSTSYKKSLDYKIAGKTGKVDLTLSGEMLNSIEKLTDRSGSITIGFDAGDAELNGKAEGNQLGSYGGVPNPERARRFLGVTQAELDDILEEFPIEEEESAFSKALALVALRRAAKEA